MTALEEEVVLLHPSLFGTVGYIDNSQVVPNTAVLQNSYESTPVTIFSQYRSDEKLATRFLMEFLLRHLQKLGYVMLYIPDIGSGQIDTYLDALEYLSWLNLTDDGTSAAELPFAEFKGYCVSIMPPFDESHQIKSP